MFGFSSSYSLLNNAILIEELIDRIKQSKYDFFAFSDTNLYAMHRVYKSFEDSHIKAWVGLKVNTHDENKQSHVFNIYPLNQEGYQILLKISYMIENKEEVTLDYLTNHGNDLLILLNTYEGLIVDKLRSDDKKSVGNLLKSYKKRFKLFYLGITNSSLEYYQFSKVLFFEAGKAGIKSIPLHEAKYFLENERDAYDALLQIGGKETQGQVDYLWYDYDEIVSKFKNYEGIFNNLNEIKNNIKFKYQMPIFTMPTLRSLKSVSPDDYLKALSNLGLDKRIDDNKLTNLKVYQDRLKYELEVIIKMGFSNYFLIVYDFVKYAKTHDILVGPGRGSAAGSLVSYSLGITEIDPIKYNLLFERFLNPERISMPDIDLDFPDYKREKVIDYVGNTYGYDHVASIQTYQTFGLLSSIRDVVKVVKLDKYRIEGIVKSVVNNKIDESDADVVLLDRIVKRLDGIPRQTGTHPAGIILANEQLSKYIPLKRGPFEFSQTQYDMNELKDLGLLKIDFLGLKNLTIIEDVLKYIYINEPNFNLSKIPLDDKLTYELLASGDTTGIFQLESAGIRQVLKKIKPTDFEDIVATLALYRPGPMDSIDQYVSQKQSNKIASIDKSIDEILKPTYGIIIYQEQIMQIANRFAGYTLAEADLLRRGIGEKSSEILNKERINFVSKAQQNNQSLTKANEIYDLIVKFADYGFNRSHSVAYSMVAYQMAYLKTNYYQAFMASLLSNVIGNETQTSNYILEAKAKGINVKNPDIFKSSDIYEIDFDSLVMPLSAVKGIDYKTAKLISANNAGFNRKNFLIFRKQLGSYLNEKQYENLVYSGAFDHFKLTKKTMLEYKDLQTIEFASFIKDFVMANLDEFSFTELSTYERDVLGFNNSYDIIAHFRKQSNEKFAYFDTSKPYQRLLVSVVSIKKIVAKNNTNMAFITFSDFKTAFEVTAFSKMYEIIEKMSKDDVFIIEIKRNLYKNAYTWQLSKATKLKID